MLQFLMLLLPALIPSWRFFETIEASPRVQWAGIARGDTVGLNWQEYRPQPQRVSIYAMFWRLFWNPARNDGLYMVSLAERLTLAPDTHNIGEIFRLISADLTSDAAPMLQFRLVFVHRDTVGLSNDLVQEVTYLSRPRPRDRIP